MKTKVTCFGVEYQSKAELARNYNISYSTLDSRLRIGYTLEEAVSLSKEEAKQHSLNNFRGHNTPLKEDEVRKRFKKYGYNIIDYTYKNNLTRMLCYDSKGYKVYMSLTCVETSAQAQRFSVNYNEENFIYNVNLYAKLHNYQCTVKEWKMGNFNQPDILCECKCGEEYWCKFNLWKHDHLGLCPTCRKTSSRYEEFVVEFLKNNDIEFIRQYRFDDCRNLKPLPFDFYLPKYNCCIEVDGEQHFEEHSQHYYGENADEKFKERKKFDKIKDDYCKNKNILLIRIPYTEFKKEKKFKETIINNLSLHN